MQASDVGDVEGNQCDPVNGNLGESVNCLRVLAIRRISAWVSLQPRNCNFICQGRRKIKFDLATNRDFYPLAVALFSWSKKCPFAFANFFFFSLPFPSLQPSSKNPRRRKDPSKYGVWEARFSPNNSLVCVHIQMARQRTARRARWNGSQVSKKAKYPHRITSTYICAHASRIMLQNADVIQPTENFLPLFFFLCNDFFLLIGHQGDPFPLALCPKKKRLQQHTEKRGRKFIRLTSRI